VGGVAKLYALFIVNKDGINLFSWNLAPERIHPDLVSSFLTAIRNLIGEISPGEEGGLRSIESQGLTILIEAGEKVFGALLLDQEDPIARECLKAMVREFERRYGAMLESWDGDVSLFEPFGEVCGRILSVIALSPYHVPRLGEGPEGDVQIPRELWAVLRFVDGHRTVAEIAREAGLSTEEAVRRVKVLLDMGLVDVDLSEPMRAIASACEETVNFYTEALRELLGRKLTTELMASALGEWGHEWLTPGLWGDVVVSDVERMAWLHLPGEVLDMLRDLLALINRRARPFLGRLADVLRARAEARLKEVHGETLAKFWALRR